MRRPFALGCLLFVMAVFISVYLFPPMQVGTDKAEGKTVYLSGKVYRKEIRSDRFGGNNYIIYLNHIVISDESDSFFENEEKIQGVLCYMEENMEVPLGSTVAVRGKAESFMQATNPGEFDSRQYYQILKLDFRLKNTKIEKISKKYNKLQELLYCIKKRSIAALEYYYKETDAGIMKAILLGDKNSLSDEVEEQYKRNGIIHVMAISGLHISMLGMGLYKILRKGKLPVGIAGVIAVLFMWCYGIMAGMSASACRAIIMFCFKITADIIGRTYDLLTALASSAVLILIEQPLYVKHCGFLLSFSAVIGIGVVLPVLEEYIKTGFLSRCLPGAAVFLTSFPIQIYFYYQYPVYSILLNLLIIPLMTLVMFSGLSVLLCAMLPVSVVVQNIGQLAAFLGHIILDIYSIACNVAEKLPGAVFVTGQPAIWQIVVYYAALFLIILRRGERKEDRFQTRIQNLIKTGILAAGLCVLLLKFHSGMEMTFLDVGQGDCIYIRSDSGKAYLIDGGSTDKTGVGTYRISPFLKSRGVSRLEAVFVSHADKDHYSGIEELLANTKNDRIQIKRLVLPATESSCNKTEGIRCLEELAFKQNMEVVYIKAGDKITDGMLKLECLNPELESYPETDADRNEQSEVLYLTYGNFSALFTGDITGEAEKKMAVQLEKKADGKPLTVLKVAHHGSRYSTDAEFLDRVQPLFSIISCGENNSYGHPHSETLNRLRDVGTVVYRTDVSGAVEITVDKERLLVSEYLK